jgi:hypothetical protein
MGLLFNSAETIKMLERVNRHFASASKGGRINKWRNKKNKFKTKALDVIAGEEGVVVDPADDDDQGTHNGNWIAWLQGLHAITQNSDKVGKLVCNQIFNALNDTNCAEIVFVTVPDSTVFVVDPPSAPLGPANAFTQVITIHTVEVGQMAAFKKKLAAQRRAAKKKKA